jgi:hypothetical protein
MPEPLEFTFYIAGDAEKVWRAFVSQESNRTEPSLWGQISMPISDRAGTLLGVVKVPTVSQ